MSSSAAPRSGRRRGSHAARRRNGRRVLPLLVLGFTLTGAGTALAFWAAGGTGSGQAAAGSALALTTSTATTSGLLYPGGTADVRVTVRNPNAYQVTLTAISGAGTVTAAGGIGTCTTTDVTFTPPTAISLVVPPKTNGADGSATLTLTSAAAMGNASDNGCQNATFTIPVSFSGASS